MIAAGDPGGCERYRALLALTLGATLCGLYWLPLRLVVEAGVGGLWAVALFYGGAALLGLWFARDQLAVARRAPWRLLGIGVSAACSVIAVSLGVIEGAVAPVLILFYLAPLWTLLLGWVLLGERPARLTLAALVVALLGVWTLLGGAALAEGAAWRGATLGLVAGVGLALTTVQVRAARHLPAATRNLAAWSLAPPLALGLAVMLDSPPPPALAPVLVALLVGALWVGLMMAALQYGMARLPLALSSLVLLLELVVGVLSAVWLAGEPLGWRELLGGAAILLAGVVVARQR
ncbi:DMT family transporter [Marichromatium bheemlicum]|uniref:DMT family transporter n=1 Tax=Marichromatium bheemlicum TaxID=365339 RepID=A0ABX1I2Y8_9GAMM|nr:DMT family transporter [Marichromatium bheemlicum]NKN31768.1 DMT family transporter [Marichromatium bheemlicum]